MWFFIFVKVTCPFSQRPVKLYKLVIKGVNMHIFKVLMVGFLIANFGAVSTTIAEEEKTQIVLLGTGTPITSPDRSGPSVAIVVGDTPYIVDFGPGIVRRGSAAKELGIEALRSGNLKHAFATHLHSDHTVGYPDLIFTTWVMGRNEPLKVFGPKGLEEMTKHILKAYEKDIDRRVNGLEPQVDQVWRVKAKDVNPGPIFEDENVKVEAIPVCHGDWDQSFGYKFITSDKTIVISGDTAYCPALEKAATGADVLIHEVIDGEALKEREEDWQNYHNAFHTNGRDVGKLATKAGVKHLILYHQLWWGGSKEAIMDQVKSTFKGKVSFGNDLDIFN